jgi:hypothetical protein
MDVKAGSVPSNLEQIMSRRTIVFALLSSLALSAGACKSTLGPNLGGIAATSANDPAIGNGGLGGGQGADDPAGDDHGGDRTGVQGRGGADDPANHQ